MLDALRRQTLRSFEVIVVEGPSTDGTAGRLAVARRCDPRGREPRAQPVALAQPGHRGGGRRARRLPRRRRDPRAALAGGARRAVRRRRASPAPGGVVLDRPACASSGATSCVSRAGEHDFDAGAAVRPLHRSRADPFLYVAGGNCAFRREALAEIDGFDEEIEYNFDEAEVVPAAARRRLARSRRSRRAVVHHHNLPSHQRTARGVHRPVPRRQEPRVLRAAQRARSRRRAVGANRRSADCESRRAGRRPPRTAHRRGARAATSVAPTPAFTPGCAARMARRRQARPRAAAAAAERVPALRRHRACRTPARRGGRTTRAGAAAGRRGTRDARAGAVRGGRAVSDRLRERRVDARRCRPRRAGCPSWRARRCARRSSRRRRCVLRWGTSGSGSPSRSGAALPAPLERFLEAELAGRRSGCSSAGRPVRDARRACSAATARGRPFPVDHELAVPRLPGARVRRRRLRRRPLRHAARPHAGAARRGRLGARARGGRRPALRGREDRDLDRGAAPGR